MILLILVGLIIGYTIQQNISQREIITEKRWYYTWGEPTPRVTLNYSDPRNKDLAISLDPKLPRIGRHGIGYGSHCLFNVTVWNLRDEIRWIDLETEYLGVFIYNRSGRIHSVREGLGSIYANDTVFLAPKGYHRFLFTWNGRFEKGSKSIRLDPGDYVAVCVVVIHEERFTLEVPLKVDSRIIKYTKSDGTP